MIRINNLLLQLRKEWYLLILPFLFAFGAFYLHLNSGDIYQNSVDPEYTIIYNGIIVSTGSFAINFIHHPATPTIFISGLSSLILRPFADAPTFVEDFLNSPEQYLKAAYFLHLFLILIVAVWGSLKLKKHTQSLLYSLLPGIALIYNFRQFDLGSRLIPEATMFIPLILISALLIIYIYKGDQADIRKKMLWQFPLLIAFGIACKLSFFPMFLIPLILLGNTKKDLWKVIRNTFIFTLLFAYPLFTNLKASSRWITNMFSHSGNHGSGAKNFIDLNAVPENFSELIGDNPSFWLLLGVNLILLIKLYSQPIKVSSLQRLRKATLVTLVSISLLTLIVLKHYALHYFLPFYLLFAVLLFYPIFYFKTVKKTGLKLINGVVLLLSLLLIFQSFTKLNELIVSKVKIVALRNNRQTEVLKHMKDDNASLIVDAPFWGTPFPAYAHSFGFMHSYKRKTYFKASLREMYPNFYLNVGWMDEFNHWDKFVNFHYIFNKTPIVYIYAGPETSGLASILERLKPIKAEGAVIKEELIWQDEENARLMRIEKQ